MFDNYPPGVNAGNQPTNGPAMDMYAGVGNQGQTVNLRQPMPAPLAVAQTQYNTQPVATGGSFKFLIIGLVTLVLVLGGALVAYQMVLKPKFSPQPTATVGVPLIDEAKTTVADDNSAVIAGQIASSSDTQIDYPLAVSSTVSTTSTASTVDQATAISSSTPSEIDSDHDGLSDDLELLKGTNKNVADTDGDGLSDGDEVFKYHTDPLKADTDGDGLSDGEEVLKYHTDPLIVDTDGDGYSDGQEVKNGYNPLGAGRLLITK